MFSFPQLRPLEIDEGFSNSHLRPLESYERFNFFQMSQLFPAPTIPANLIPGKIPEIYLVTMQGLCWGYAVKIPGERSQYRGVFFLLRGERREERGEKREERGERGERRETREREHECWENTVTEGMAMQAHEQNSCRLRARMPREHVHRGHGYAGKPRTVLMTRSLRPETDGE